MANKIHVTTDSGEAAATFSALTVEELAVLVNDISQATEPSRDPTPITTGASPIDADPEVLYYEITTAGTAGQEIINLPLFPLDDDGLNISRIGQTVIFRTKTLTDPSDVPVIKVNNGVPFVYGKNFANSDYKIVANPGVILDFAGAVAVFRWIGTTFQFDYAAADNADDSTYDVTTTVTFNNPFRLANASVNLVGLATADPHIAGRLWNSTGTLKISAG